MSASSLSDLERLALNIPDGWRTFLDSGEYAATRLSIDACGSEVPVDLVARLEFLDERNLAIHLALADGARSPRDGSGRDPTQLLTARERDVIALIAMGNDTEEIAMALHVSPSTVRTHVRNAMSKLGAHTRAHLVAVAMEGQDPDQVGQTDDATRAKSPPR